MGVFSREKCEQTCCWSCGKAIKAPSIFINKTMSGHSICASCFVDRHLNDLGGEFRKMRDEDIELFLDIMVDNKYQAKIFEP